jgi:hypothetical protein
VITEIPKHSAHPRSLEAFASRPAADADKWKSQIARRTHISNRVANGNHTCKALDAMVLLGAGLGSRNDGRTGWPILRCRHRNMRVVDTGDSQFELNGIAPGTRRDCHRPSPRCQRGKYTLSSQDGDDGGRVSVAGGFEQGDKVTNSLAKLHCRRKRCQLAAKCFDCDAGVGYVVILGPVDVECAQPECMAECGCIALILQRVIPQQRSINVEDGQIHRLSTAAMVVGFLTPKLSCKGIKSNASPASYRSARDCSNARSATGTTICGRRHDAIERTYAAASLRTRSRLRDRSASQRSCCIC